MIRLASSESVPFDNECGTFIIAVSNTSDIVELTKNPNGDVDNLIDVITEKQIICSEISIQSSPNTIEQEFDELASKGIVAELRGESENDDGCDEDEDGDEDSSPNVDDSNLARLQYKDFPTKILDGCKLLYKGPDLLNMISRFYCLECDQCE